MAEANLKEATVAQQLAQLDRRMEAEIEIMHRRCPDCFVRIGEILTEMKPLLKGRFHKYIKDRYGYSPASISRYMRMYDDKVRLQKTHRRVSDVDPPRPDHQSKDFRAYREERERARATQQDRMEAPDRAVSGMSDKTYAHKLWGNAFREEALKHHPDRGGSQKIMAQLNRINARIRRCIDSW